MGRQRWMMVGKKHLTDYHAPCVQNSLCNSRQISHQLCQNDENPKHQFGLGIYTKALLGVDIDEAYEPVAVMLFPRKQCHRQRANQLSKDV